MSMSSSKKTLEAPRSKLLESLSSFFMDVFFRFPSTSAPINRTETTASVPA